jgi:RNA polymerase sigma factor (sigma-70 family)
MPYEYIFDAIEDSIIILPKAPERVLANRKIKYKWLRRVAFRKVLAESKRLRRFISIEHTQYDMFTVDAETGFENAETVEVLMKELSPLVRETADLHFLQGYSYKEISQILCAKPETIKKRCKRAKAELREIWQMIK